MLAKFLGQDIVRTHYVLKYARFGDPELKETYFDKPVGDWKEFYQQELKNIEFKVDSFVNINNEEVQIKKIIYELDGSITYKTSKILNIDEEYED